MLWRPLICAGLRTLDLDQQSGFRGADRACDACYEAFSANLEAARPRDGLFFHAISILDGRKTPPALVASRKRGPWEVLAKGRNASQATKLSANNIGMTNRR